MIKIKKEDNLYDIIKKIDKSKSDKQIVLQIPFWHPILYNYISLKSIKNKVLDKRIIISTSDIASKKIWKPLWIKYSIIQDNDFIDNRKNLLKYNYTFFEYFKYELKKYLNRFLSIFSKNKKINDIKKQYEKYYKQKTNFTFFIIILLTVSLIFLYIFYFVLNKTNVYVTPAIKVQTKSQNFIFSEKISEDISDPRYQLISKINKTIELEESFKTSWIKQEEKYKAKWEVEFINNLETPIKLLPHTRLLSGSGVLYETLEWTSIPSAKKNNNWILIPWITKAKITSKFKDNNWEFTWEKGNINEIWEMLTIPGLKDDENNVFAKNISPIIWWENTHIKIIWINDIENAKEIMLEKLKKTVIDNIYKELKQKNEANNITYKIIWVDNIYDFKNINIELTRDFKEEEKVENFKLRWIITASTYIYNIDSVISKLKTEIEVSIIPEKENILFINDQSIRVSNVLIREDKPFYLKATVEIEVFLSYNFENESDNYVKRLKSTISWIDKIEAEKILINEEKISNVKIDVRPFFLNNISSFFDNIKFVIEE